MLESSRQLNFGLGLAGAGIGGALGFFAFFWIAGHGFYALALPGALLGLGGGFASRMKSTALGGLCGIAAILLGIVTEWRYAPFMTDDSFTYFLTHLPRLSSITQLLIVVGGVFGFWFGQGRERFATNSSSNAPPASE